MLKNKFTKSESATHRNSHDRRRDEVEVPFVGRERRKRVERRLPVVEENAVSLAEWLNVWSPL
ncbi:MAG: hypothetical protein ACOYNV_16290 [Propionivibrio sp.]